MSDETFKPLDFGDEVYLHDPDSGVDKVTLIAVRTPEGSLYRQWLVEFFDGSRQWEPEYGLRPIEVGNE